MPSNGGAAALGDEDALVAGGRQAGGAGGASMRYVLRAMSPPAPLPASRALNFQIIH